MTSQNPISNFPWYSLWMRDEGSHNFMVLVVIGQSVRLPNLEGLITNWTAQSMVFSVAYYLEFCNATLSIDKCVGFYQPSAIMSKLSAQSYSIAQFQSAASGTKYHHRCTHPTDPINVLVIYQQQVYGETCNTWLRRTIQPMPK